MRLIAVTIPPLFVITTSWAQRNGTHNEEENHADRKRDRDDSPGS
jgi:hypothetical protein